MVLSEYMERFRAYCVIEETMNEYHDGWWIAQLSGYYGA